MEVNMLTLGYARVSTKEAKSPLSTIASYDEMIVKNVKLPTLSDHPTSSVVRTIPD
jgi:hypothetical protein